MPCLACWVWRVSKTQHILPEEPPRQTDVSMQYAFASQGGSMWLEKKIKFGIWVRKKGKKRQPSALTSPRVLSGKKEKKGKKIKWKFKVKLMLSSINAIRTAHITNMSASRACWVWIMPPPLPPPSLSPLPHHPHVSCNKTSSGKNSAKESGSFDFWSDCFWGKFMKLYVALCCDFIFSLASKAQQIRFSHTER